MDFFVQPAWAQAAQQQPDMLTGLLPIIIIFVVFYFLLIRPQTKRAKQHREMVAALQPGDEVITGGGIVGRITRTDEQFATVEIAKGVEVKVQRQTVTAVLPKGSYKSDAG
jgi:preprotein translocase subunit YajC